MAENRMDPNAPATRHFLQVLAEMRQQYIATHTTEECRALAAQAAENRRIRQMMINRPRPVISETAAS